MRARGDSLLTRPWRSVRDWRAWARSLRSRRVRLAGRAQYPAMLLRMPRVRQMARCVLKSTLRIDVRTLVQRQCSTTREAVNASTVHVLRDASGVPRQRVFAGREDTVVPGQDGRNHWRTALHASGSHHRGLSLGGLPGRRSRMEDPPPRPGVARLLLQHSASGAVPARPPGGASHAGRAGALKWRRTEVPGDFPRVNLQRLVRHATNGRERVQVGGSEPREPIRAAPPATGLSQSFSGANPALSPQWVSELTTKVVGEIDRRMVAYRERMGTVF